MKTIIALDDSPCSERIIKALKDRTWKATDLVKLVSVLEPPCGQESCELDDEVARKRMTHANRICARAKKSLEDFPCNVELEITEGDAVEELLDIAKCWDADRIIVGTHGHAVCPHNLERSVSHILREKAPCEVEIVA
jgi:nucleotide-binding universal stress UspA family protein